MYPSLLLAALLAGASPGDDATTRESQQAQRDQSAFDFDPVRILIAEGRHEEARHILNDLKTRDVDQIQVMFLEAEILGREGEWSAAARIYRKILSHHPQLLRVRLELARSFFAMGDYPNARKQFEIVLATEGLPEPVVRNIEKFLTAIQQRKFWTVNFSAGLAQDTNINSATDDRQITLFGLPFELSDDARASSGVGVTGDISGSLRLPLRPRLSLELSGRAQHTDYSNGASFDHSIFQLTAGPRFFVHKNTELQLAATGSHSRFGGRPFYWSQGGQINLRHRANENLYLDAVLDAQALDFSRDETRDGWTLTAILQASYLVSRVDLVQGFVGVTEELTDVDALSSSRYRLGAAYRREFSFGLTAELSGEVALRRFKDLDRLHGTKRQDHTLRLSTSLSKRDWQIGGFFPVLGYSFYRGFSNIDFHDYDRHRVDLGFTRIF